jgi:hypothetical protein
LRVALGMAPDKQMNKGNGSHPVDNSFLNWKAVFISIF